MISINIAIMSSLTSKMLYSSNKINEEKSRLISKIQLNVLSLDVKSLKLLNNLIKDLK